MLELDVDEFDHSVARLRRRLARCARNGRGRVIPEELWTTAAELAAQHGVFKTARALGLNHSSLTGRVQSLQPPAPAAAPAFVEWLAPLAGRTIAECVLEVPSRQGGSLRLEMRNVEPQGLAALVRELAG